MGIGTFGAFTQARLGIYAAQTGITVTGNNISNINTPGYTRQRLNQVSLYAAGSDRYYAEGDVRVGQGALVKSISQIRNPYLDIRYREENAKVGFYDARLEGLNSISRVLDEVGMGDASKGEDGFGILGLDISKLYTALQNITDQTGQQEYDDSVKAVASNLVSKLHAYAGQLEQVRVDTIHDFKQDVDAVNNHLDAIRAYNEEIRKCEIHGDPALELRDKRNVELDELSKLVDINVVYGEEEIAAGVRVEKMSLYLGDGNPDKSVKTDESLLIDGVYSANIILGRPVENPFYGVEIPTDTTERDKLKKEVQDELGLADLPADDKLKEYTQAQYLKLEDDGKTKTPVSDVRDATILTDDADNPNYNMMITELKNKNGDLNFVGHTYVPTAVDDINDLPPEGHGEGQIQWNSKTNMASLEIANKPEKGDKTIEIYTRTLKPGVTTNPPTANDYTYTKQVYEQIVSKPVVLDDNDLYGELQAERELLTEEGVFIDQSTVDNIDENATIKRGIGYYQKVLDLLANQLATSLNEANQGFLMNDKTGEYITKGTNDRGETIGVPLEINGHSLNKDWEKTDAALRNTVLTGVGLDPTKVTKEDDLKDIGLTWKKVADAYLKGQTWQPNATNNGGKFVPENREDVKDSNDNIILPGWENAGKANQDAIFVGGPLFSNANDSNDATGITASNINVSAMWTHSSILVRSFNCPDGHIEPASGQSDNLVHLKYVAGEQEFDFTPNQLDSSPNASGKPLFTGTFFQMWNDIGGTLGQDQSQASTMLDTYYQSALAIDTDRDSVSSVDFNDEAMNLMMYSKSYNAACRLMTTIDSVLDKLINNTGMTT